MLRAEDALHDGHELVVPAAQGRRVAPAEPLDRGDRAVDVRPPLERAAVARDERHVELRLDVARAVAFEVEVGVPRHRGDRPLKERVGVVQKARMPRVLERGEAAARDRRPVDRQHAETSLAEVRRQDQGVVTGTKDDGVVVARSGTGDSGLGTRACLGTRDGPPVPRSARVPSPEPWVPTHSHRNTFADNAVQTANMIASTATSARCGIQPSPRQMPRNSDTA